MAARFEMAVVEAGSPLTIKLESSPTKVVAAEDFVGGLATDDRAQAAFLGDRLVVLARAGGAAPASTTASGIVELATSAETIAGTDAVRAVTPAGLSSALESHRQLDTTNSVAKMVTQYGIGKITGLAATIISETVTFPVAFASVPVVIANSIGGRANGAFDPSGLFAPSGREFSPIEATSATSFNMNIRRADFANLDATKDYYYSWAATGVLA